MKTEEIFKHLLEHDEIKGRFIYSPNTPHWENQVKGEALLQNLQQSILKSGNLDIYAHVPFCRSLCTFCGCNIKVIAQNDQEAPFVDALLKEWDFYKRIIPSQNLRSLSLGGGTPTYLSSHVLARLIKPFEATKWKQIEIDPRLTKEEHFSILKDFAFNRVTIGVQDIDEDILKTLNRFQTIQEIEKVIDLAHKSQISEIAIDLIYGLPGQTEQGVEATVRKLVEYAPAIFNLYPLAVVPWLKDSQRAFGHFELPSIETKWRNYLRMSLTLEELGYIHQGMGHFFKKDSPLYQKILSRQSTRELMGILPFERSSILGLGPGSMSFTDQLMAQNERVTEKYIHQIQKGMSPIQRSHLMSESDKKKRSEYLSLFINHISPSVSTKISQEEIEYMKVFMAKISES